ncbi:hypothetical protein EYF80_045834 [Liparis tanakae]|uniref:Uncharacterized protein n=1 Tax=Liparis tanakae TaxID=230148 RepID=A0A4Z2FS39_9TELE|nr:hypothetical protein EYF80_045834 [Liparis tanakae]
MKQSRQRRHGTQEEQKRGVTPSPGTATVESDETEESDLRAMAGNEGRGEKSETQGAKSQRRLRGSARETKHLANCPRRKTEWAATAARPHSGAIPVNEARDARRLGHDIISQCCHQNSYTAMMSSAPLTCGGPASGTKDDLRGSRYYHALRRLDGFLRLQVLWQRHLSPHLGGLAHLQQTQRDGQGLKSPRRKGYTQRYHSCRRP